MMRPLYGVPQFPFMPTDSALAEFYEETLCWLGRPRESYRLLSESVIPRLATWVRGTVEDRSVKDWQPEDIDPILFPVAQIGHDATVLSCEALLLCGSGSYYNPCDVAIFVFVQRPEERFSELCVRIRATQAQILRGPSVSVGEVNLTRKERDYINTKFLIWPHHMKPSESDTLVAQGFALIQLEMIPSTGS
jgi:hypothetical protein